MRISRSKRATAVALLILVLGFSLLLQARQLKSPSDQERAKAVGTIRLINTAELSYKLGSTIEKGVIAAHGRYATWQELASSGVLKMFPNQWTLVKDFEASSEPEVMAGYHLDLLVSSDGKSYLVALHDKREGEGLFSVFSDQNGIIFLGSPLQ